MNRLVFCSSRTKLYSGNRDVQRFCSRDLDLDPITFVYELDPYSLKMYQVCENELRTRLSKVIVQQTYRQTDKTDRIKIIFTPIHKWSVK